MNRVSMAPAPSLSSPSSSSNTLRRLVHFAQLSLGVLVFGCSKPSATVQGHIRTMFESGELRLAAHGRAGLVRASDVEKEVGTICDRYHAERKALFARHQLEDMDDTSSVLTETPAGKPTKLAPPAVVLAVMDSAARLASATQDAVDSALAKRSTTVTDIDAGGSYRIDNVKTGDYVLWAINTFGKTRLIWWHPVTIISGTNAVDLDTRHATAGRKRYCGIPL
jgi:hypothetical protein